MARAYPRSKEILIAVGALALSIGCGEPDDLLDAGAMDASIEVDAGLVPDAEPGPDANNDIAYHGVVSVGDVSGGAFVGQIRGAFVASSDLPVLLGGRAAIAGAPGCFELLPPPPVVPTYHDAGTLVFSGLILAAHMLSQNPDGDYSFAYANLLGTPGTPISLTVPGAGSIEPVMATVATPDPADVGNWTPGSTGVWTYWTPGNGDYVLLRFNTSEGARECEVADTGSFLVPAQAFAPGDAPDGGYFVFQRVIETTTLSPSGTQELRFRAFTEDQML